MAVDFSNIHSLKKFKKNSEGKRVSVFPFEREEVFYIEKPEKYSLYPFFTNDFSLKNLVFFDTETTGLSHGAGNMVFLAGIGFVEGEKFIVKQFFVSNPSVEFRLIETVIELFKERNIVVSYNGKCFDIPIIKTRCIMNAIDEPDIEQIDLYHISRFIWRDRLSSFRLSDIEREILNFERKDDLPGSMAPFAYREFLLRGETELLDRVFKHNLRDVVSLFYLFFEVGNESSQDVLFAKAKKFFKLGMIEECLECLRVVVKESLDDNFKKKVYILASQCLKKKGDLEKAERLWLKIRNLTSHIELAKFYEHKKKDLVKALKHTNIALTMKQASLKEYQELVRRKRRILRKIAQLN